MQGLPQGEAQRRGDDDGHRAVEQRGGDLQHQRGAGNGGCQAAQQQAVVGKGLEEVEDIVKISNSVVINIGTMNSELLDLYVLAGKAANKYNKPVILDPVGVFATNARTEITNKLLNETEIHKSYLIVFFIFPLRVVIPCSIHFY